MMGFFDKLFRRGKRGAAAGAVPAARAESGGARRFYGQKWAGGLSNPSPSLMIDPAGVRAQTRDLSHKSTQAAALINSAVDTEIDSGLVLAPEPLHRVLGISQEEAAAWAADVAARFDLWAQSKKASRSGRYNFYQAQRLLSRYNTRDGESFLMFNYSGRADVLSPLQIEVLDPDQIAEDGYVFTRSLGAVPGGDGVIRDEYGEETGYKVWVREGPGLTPRLRVIPRIGDRSGRVFMTHGVAELEYAGQGRGFSKLGVSIQDLENILDLALAQIKKGINQSNIVLVANGRDPLNIGGDGVRIMGEAAAEGPAQPTVRRVPETVLDRPGSLAIIQEEGETLTPFQNTAPDVSFSAFMEAYFSYVAAASGTSSELARKHFNQNYHSSRATLILCYRIAIQRRYQLGTDHLDPVYEAWLSGEIGAGRVTAPGWLDPRIRAAWTRHRWNGTGIPNTDPVREASSWRMKIESNVATPQDWADADNASDVMNNIEKNARINAAARDVGPLPWNADWPPGELAFPGEDNAGTGAGGDRPAG